MAFIQVGRENSTGIDLYYEDHGSGPAVILIHGYPLSGSSWEKQVIALLNAGCRVITYDRRGFGRSSQPTTGYNFDTFASDLRVLIEHLDLNKVSLVGFSMGGGEVARYLGLYGSQRVEKAVIIGGVPPYLIKTADNPGGVDPQVFAEIQQDVETDRFRFLRGFFGNFYNAPDLLSSRVSQEVIDASWNVAANASAYASIACVPTWHEDFRSDLAKIDIPLLVIHGDADQIVPLDASGRRTAALVKGARLLVVRGGPHAVPWTHASEVNAELVRFLAAQVRSATASSRV